jgi:hypothetical protein
MLCTHGENCPMERGASWDSTIYSMCFSLLWGEPINTPRHPSGPESAGQPCCNMRRSAILVVCNLRSAHRQCWQNA